MATLEKIIEEINNNGFFSFIRKGYKKLVRREYIPRKIGMYNGVAVRRPSILEIKDVYPDAEIHTLSNFSQFLNRGDEVVVIGGGWGIVAVKAAKIVGKTGRVIVFEGSQEYVERIHETAQLNGVENILTVNHAIVGNKENVWGSSSGADFVSPTDLPDCDVLQLDCEGSELEILREITISPQTIFVEVHGMFGVSIEQTRREIKKRGYTIVDENVYSESRGGVVLTAIK